MRHLSAILLLAALLAAGCTAGSGWTSSLQPDHFRLHLKSSGGSTDKEWEWETAGGDLRLVASLDAAAGDVNLTLRDPHGAVVYAATMLPGETARDVTLPDAPAGKYRVEVRTWRLAGALSVRIDST